MQPQNKKLKRPITLQKKMLLRAALGFVVLGLISLAVHFYPTVSQNFSEFVAKNIDAKLERVLVEGTNNLENEELLSIFQLKKGDSLVGFKSSQMREKLQELDWVKEVVVERQLPSTVKISVYEYNPIARLEEGENLWVVDATGHQITAITSEEFKHLPLLKGEQAAENAAELFGILLSKNIRLGEDVVEARFIGERRWDIAFASDVWVMLPENNAERALDILKSLDHKKNVLSMKGGVVDLRLEDRIVLRLPPHAKIKERIL